MDTFKLTIKRSGFTGSAMRMHYRIGDALTGTVPFFKPVTLELPRERAILKLYCRTFLLPDPEKEILLTPNKDTEEIVIDLNMKLRMIAFFPPFSFFYPTCDIVPKKITCRSNTPQQAEDEYTVGIKPVWWKKVLRASVVAVNFALMAFILLWAFQLWLMFCYLDGGQTAPIFADTLLDRLFHLELLGTYVLAPLLLLVMMMISKGLSVLSDKLRQRKSEPISLRRSFILYLRCFIDDRNTTVAVDKLFSSGKSEEEITADVLSDIAPVVAIGNPQDNSLPMGASRIYVDEAHWKGKVLEMLASAELVVLRLGETPNLWWEIDTALTHCPKEKIVFFIPAMKNFNAVLKLCEQLKKNGVEIPEELDLTVKKTGKGTISSILYFTDGKLCCRTLKTSRISAFFTSYEKMLRNALQPLLHSFGFAEKRYNIIRVSNIIFLLLMLNFVIFGAMSYGKIELTRHEAHQLAENALQNELLEHCRKRSANFAELIENQDHPQRMQTLFTLLDAGLKKVPDDIYAVFTIRRLEICSKISEDLSYYDSLRRGKTMLSEEKYAELLDVLACCVDAAASGKPDLPPIGAEEVAAETAYFQEAAKHFADVQLSREQNFKRLMNILRQMEDKNLNAIKFLRYLIQEQTAVNSP